MSELKSCPFCGGEAFMGGYDAYSCDSSFDAIECSKCGFMSYPCSSDSEIETAKRDWNTRASGWISVDDRLPVLSEDKTNEEVVAQNSLGHVFACHYSYNKYAKTEKGRAPRWERHNRVYDGNKITHWMPLPEPLKD